MTVKILADQLSCNQNASLHWLAIARYLQLVKVTGVGFHVHPIIKFGSTCTDTAPTKSVPQATLVSYSLDDKNAFITAHVHVAGQKIHQCVEWPENSPMC